MSRKETVLAILSSDQERENVANENSASLYYVRTVGDKVSLVKRRLADKDTGWLSRPHVFRIIRDLL